jgi:DNA end-binding protein Ku
LIDQISTDTYDPTMFEDEEKKRILAAIDAKIEGKQVVAVEHPEDAHGGAEVIDLTEMLRASLTRAAKPPAKRPAKPAAAEEVVTPLASAQGKGAKRAPKVAKVAEEAAAPARARARK